MKACLMYKLYEGMSRTVTFAKPAKIIAAHALHVNTAGILKIENGASNSRNRAIKNTVSLSSKNFKLSFSL